jgi:hypothetical protein
MSNDIENTWARRMTGKDVDVAGFLDDVMKLVPLGKVFGRVLDNSHLEFGVGDSVVRLETDAAISRMRMVCAALAVRLGPSGANLYGGRIASRISIGDAQANLNLAFDNNPGTPWFELNRFTLKRDHRNRATCPAIMFG